MKRIFIFFFALSTLGYTYCNEHILSLTSELCSSKSVYLSLPRVDIEDITPFTHTIAYNLGDSILGLVTPPIKDQGHSQQSCAGWAFGYGCASIQAYNIYQDWNWAKRSPAFLYNQAHDPTSCGAGNIDTVLNILFRQGVCSFYLMPYDSTDCNTMPDSIQRADAQLNRSARLRLSDTTDINEYKQILKIGHPIGVNTKYATDLQTLCNTPSAQGRWISISNNDTTKSHALCIVGYDDHQHLFKAMNSWGTNSGDNGFVWISYNLVQNGIFNQAYVFESYGNGFSAQIEGPSTMTDTTAWYHIRNVPTGATILWSINNIPDNSLSGVWEFVLASSPNVDSVRVAFRQIPAYPGPGITSNDNSEFIRPIRPVYQKADLTIIASYGTTTYSTTKSIKRQIGSSPFLLKSSITGSELNVGILNGSDSQLAEQNNIYTLELWHTMYGRMRTQEVQSMNEQISTIGLPQGVYVILLKENGSTIAQTKVITQ